MAWVVIKIDADEESRSGGWVPDRPTPYAQVARLAPQTIRFSQSTIGYLTRLRGMRLSVDELVQTFRREGYVSEPIQVVRMPDGGLTSLDNRRLWAARQAGLREVTAILCEPGDKFAATTARRVSLQTSEDIIDRDGVLGAVGAVFAEEGDQPDTILQAIVFRCFRQRTLGSDSQFPLHGTMKPPRVTGRPKESQRSMRGSGLDRRRRFGREARGDQKGFGR